MAKKIKCLEQGLAFPCSSAIHCVLSTTVLSTTVTQIIAEAILVTYEVFGERRSGANGDRDGDRSRTRELKDPLPPSSHGAPSVFAMEATEEENAEFETFADFQRRQGAHAQPPSTLTPASQSAEAGMRPPPPRYQPREPTSPYS